MPVNISTCRVVVFFKTIFFRRLFLFIAFYLFIFSSICPAQRDKIDSLQKILPSLKDTARIDCMNELSFQYIRLLIRDSSEYFEAASYKESKKLNYINGIAAAISNQAAIVEYFDNDFVQAEALARKSLALFGKMNNNRGIENTIMNLWFSLFAQSKYDEAYIICIKAI